MKREREKKRKSFYYFPKVEVYKIKMPFIKRPNQFALCLKYAKLRNLNGKTLKVIGKYFSKYLKNSTSIYLTH